MKLYIPEIGDELILTKFWRFNGKTKKLTKIRFWARLSDINTIECEKLPLS